MIDQRHLAEESAARNGLDRRIADLQFDFTAENHVHVIARIALREEGLPGGKRLGHRVVLENG